MSNFFINKRRIFIFTLVLSFFFQLPIWSGPYVLDMERWAKQGQYVEENDVRQYDVSAAYGHPGGPIILAMIGAHEFLGAPYSVETLTYLLSFLNALLVALICALCFELRQNWWWLGVFFALSISRMYFYATPPSALSALLLVLLALLTLLIYERKGEVKLPVLFSWALVAGLSVATRFDIGALTAFAFLAFLFVQNLSQETFLRKVLFVRAGFLVLYSVFFFVVFNPFMWFMPIQHLKDFFNKALYHYASYAQTVLPTTVVIDFSWLLALSFFVFLILFLSREKLSSGIPLPPPFVFMLMGLTVVLYIIFLSSSYQSVRYFMPMVLIWETILPLLLVHLLYLNPGSKKILSWVPFGLFVLFQTGLFVAFILL